MNDDISPEHLAELKKRINAFDSAMEARSHIEKRSSPVINIAKVAKARNGVHLLENGYFVAKHLREKLLQYKMICIEFNGLEHFNNEFMLAAFGTLHRHYESDLLRHLIVFSGNNLKAEFKGGFGAFQAFTMANAYASVFYTLPEDQRKKAPFSHVLNKVIDE